MPSLDGLLLGVDLGTTTVKVGAFSVDGKAVQEHSQPVTSSHLRAGWAEQDANGWVACVLTGLESVLHYVDPMSIVAMGVVSQVNTHVFVDEAMRPVMQAITWQDQRCAEIARELDGQFSLADKQSLWGAPFSLDASYLVSRAAWVARHCPDAWARTRWVLSPKDYLIAVLTGTVCSDAISSIGLVDPGGDGYLREPVELVDGLMERLPPLRPPESLVGYLRRPAALGHVGVVTGTMDAFGNLFGSAAAEPGRAMLSCGTSIIVAGASERSRPDAGVISFPRLGALHVHAGPTQAGGDSLRWWAKASGVGIETVLGRSQDAESGAGGVLFTPHLAGQRAPLWDSDVRGSFLGLSTRTTAQDLARAVVEGVAYSARAVFDVVESVADMPMTRVSVSGGASRSDHWCQVFADVLQRPLHRVATPDTAVLGAALLCGVGTGYYADIADAGRKAVEFATIFEPDQRHAGAYDGMFHAYQTSYAALRGFHDELSVWRARNPSSPRESGYTGSSGLSGQRT